MKILYYLITDDDRYKGHLKFFLISYFLVLFNYPLVRSASTTMFFEEFGAKSSPTAWLYTVFFLSFAIFVFNRFQSKQNVQKVMLWISILSALLFFLSTFGSLLKVKYASYVSFIWKEIYIVMQVHLVLAYANNYFRKNEFKSIIGPVGAIGSIGGILGGLFTTYLSKSFGTEFVSWVSILFILLPAVSFYQTPELKDEGQKTKQSPVESINVPGVKKYIYYIGLIVMLSQFVINIADFKFNLAFEESIVLSSDRTAFLGTVYTWTNTISLVLQFVFLPFLLPRISERSLHIFIPLTYLIFLTIASASGFQLLLPVAIFYIYLKASDYSLFSAGKELLYQPLFPEQKYGAKYLTDMLVYRVAKAMIAAVLIYLQSSSILNMLMVGFLILWMILIIKVFRIHRSQFN
jgi:AAA family ATP:ADP antiporter